MNLQRYPNSHPVSWAWDLLWRLQTRFWLRICRFQHPPARTSRFPQTGGTSCWPLLRFWSSVCHMCVQVQYGRLNRRCSVSETTILFELKSRSPIAFGERCVAAEPGHCRLRLRLEQTDEWQVGALQFDLRLLEEFGWLPVYSQSITVKEYYIPRSIFVKDPYITRGLTIILVLTIIRLYTTRGSGTHPGMSWLKLMVMLAVDSPSAFLATTRYSPPSSGFTSATSSPSVHSFGAAPWVQNQNTSNIQKYCS